MARPVDVGDVLRPKPTPGTMLRRGVTRRCPRCGERDIFRTWFRLKPRCPQCGYQFERESGFFVGAYLINFAIAEGFLFLLIMAFVGWKATNPDAGVRGPMIAALVIAVVAPVLTYPFSQTIWAAFDLLMTPMEMDEIVAASDAVNAGAPEGAPEDDGPLSEDDRRRSDP